MHFVPYQMDYMERTQRSAQKIHHNLQYSIRLVALKLSWPYLFVSATRSKRIWESWTNTRWPILKRNLAVGPANWHSLASKIPYQWRLSTAHMMLFYADNLVLWSRCLVHILHLQVTICNIWNVTFGRAPKGKLLAATSYH